MCAAAQKPIRVLVADGHAIVRTGIRVLLKEARVFRPFDVDEAESSEEAIARVDQVDYKAVLVDFFLPGRGGVKTTEVIMHRRPDLAVLGIGYQEERRPVDLMLAAGAKGFILANVGPDTLLAAIRTVMEGKRFLSNELAQKFLEVTPEPMPSDDPLELLTSREKEVFRGIMGGLTNAKIASRLYIGKRTVDKHREHIMAKLGVRNAVELVQVGMKAGWLGRV